VFPWVLADYISEEIDLEDESIYRDLSKPMGAQGSEERLDVYRQRYESWCDPDTPPFHYGTHYSSGAFVSYYMIRCEPFTSLHIQLQGGRFDISDRLFHSVARCWEHCTTLTSEVKELIPEFYYQPDFLRNINKLDLGRISTDQTTINEVVLPPWANDSADEFVRIMRDALESEYVSNNLHKWIDLVFGYKQQGEEAVKAINTFYYLTYAGAVDLESLSPEERIPIEAQIAHFGQTPLQILKEPHPPRNPGARRRNWSRPFRHMNPGLPPRVSGPSAQVTEAHQKGDAGAMCAAWAAVREGGHGAQRLSVPMAKPAMAVLGPCSWILYGGHADGSIGCHPGKVGMALNKSQRGVQTARGHMAAVTCVALKQHAGKLYIATGSLDHTVAVWRASRPDGSAVQLPTAPLHILCAHLEYIVAVCIAPALDAVVSASSDSTIVVSSVRRGRSLRHLQLTTGGTPTEMVTTAEDHLVVYSADTRCLEACTLNGSHISGVVLEQPISCLRAVPGGGFVLAMEQTSHTLIVWQVNTMTPVEHFVGAPSPCLDVLLLDKDRTVCLFLESGTVLCFRTREDDECEGSVMVQKLAKAGY